MAAFLSHLSPLGLAAALVLAFTALALGSVLAMERWGTRIQLGRASSDYGLLVGGPMATVFALVFALVVIAIWQNYDRVRNQVSEEAGCIHNIYRCLESYPPAVRDPARALVRRYVQQVINHEWQALGEGREDPEAHRLITEVNARLVAYRPRSLGELPLHQEVLAQVSRYRELRHARLEAGIPTVDATMWISLDIGTLILLVYCSLWGLEGEKRNLFLAATRGASLGIVFFLLLAYNHPFAGPAAVDPGPFQSLLENNWSANGRW